MEYIKQGNIAPDTPVNGKLRISGCARVYR